MSLVTMTFGNSNSQGMGSLKGIIKVLKADRFFGTEETCVIGKLLEGAVTKEMIVPGTDKKIVSVESNYGEGTCDHTGAQVVLMVANSNKEEYEHGKEIAFEKVAIQVEKAKPKGRVIIA